MKEDFSPGSDAQKMINFEHVVVQSVVLLFFLLLHFKKFYLMSVPKIIEITYAVYQGLSQRKLSKEYVGRKVNNATGFHLHRKFAFACTLSFFLRVIT